MGKQPLAGLRVVEFTGSDVLIGEVSTRLDGASPLRDAG